MDKNEQKRDLLLSVPSYIFVPAVDNGKDDDQASNCSISLGSVASLDEMELIFDSDKSSTRWAEESGQCALHTASRADGHSIQARSPPASQSRARAKRLIRKIPTKTVKSSYTTSPQALSDMAPAAASVPTWKRQGSNDLPPKAPRRRGSIAQASVRGALAA